MPSIPPLGRPQPIRADMRHVTTAAANLIELHREAPALFWILFDQSNDYCARSRLAKAVIDEAHDHLRRKIKAG